MNTQPTMPGFEDDPAILRGDGRYGFTARVEDDDLVVRNARATWFGGSHDPYDNGHTASGVSTRLHPDLLGCALPMNGFKLTRGSPIPDLPWMTTEVEIYRPSNGRRLTVPLIDLGPAAPPHAHAAIDLTVAAFRKLGGDPKVGEMEVCFRIRGAAHRLPADILAAVRASRREATPTPRTADGTARPGPLVSRSPAPVAAVVPPATVGAARAQTTEQPPGAGATQGGAAVGRVNRSVPPSVAASLLAACLLSTACMTARPNPAWPETFSLLANADHDQPGGWDRASVGVRLAWRLQPLPVAATNP